MIEIRETAIDHIAGDDYATFCSSEKKWINYIHKLKKDYPDEVDIRHINDDGSLVVRIPASWVKIKPKKKVLLTQEQIEASKARLEVGRLKRLEKIGDVIGNVSHGKEQESHE